MPQENQKMNDKCNLGVSFEDTFKADNCVKGK